MRRALWFVGVPLAALVGGVTGSAPVYVIGLAVPVSLVGPLALLTGSLLATLRAGWVANLPILFTSSRSVSWATPARPGDGSQTSSASDGSRRIAPGLRGGDPDRW